MNAECRPVIFIPSPRDIPEFLAATAQIRAPKIWVKYHPQEIAYQGAREWFLGQEDFTHLVILPDDLIITQDDFDSLKHVICTHGIDILSGWCQNTIRDDGNYGSVDSNLSYDLPKMSPRQAKYEDFNFIPVSRLENKSGFIKILYSGFAPTFISRNIVEKVPFRADFDCCVDTCFGLDLFKLHIPQYCYLNVRTRHIKTSPDILQVGKKEKMMYFEY